VARERLVWPLFPSYLVVCVVATVVVAWFALWQFRGFYLRATTRGLEARARFVSFNMMKQAWAANPNIVDRLCKNLGRETDTRITVIDEAGEVLGDSDADPAKMGNHLKGNRAEIRKALSAKVAASAERFSETTREKTIFVAVPVVDGGKVMAVVRTSLPMRQVDEAMRSIYGGIGLSLLVVAGIVGGVSLILSRRISRPLETLKDGARRFAEGHLNHRLAVPALEEAGSLAETLNQMAARLAQQVRRLEQLEGARRDFVANVSHELRTTVTPIRAAVENLRHGAMDQKQQAGRFLAMIARQADRLAAIIEDLLRLSQIEEYEQGRGLELRRTELRPVLEAAVTSCGPRAQGKEIPVDIRCPEGLEVRVNPPLFENAMINLGDNAIKYSQPQWRLRVEADSSPDGVDIRVRDEGCGIQPEHLPRLFERFYRVDKARSRNAGGTGLGLSIVKHIVQLHGGSVGVASTPGEATTFTIHLPPPDRPVRVDA
jgi:signal transduction histidine kinase